MITRSQLGPAAPLLAVLAVAACGEPAPPTPSAECEPLWSAEPAAEFVDLLTRVTATELRAWEGYDLGDAAYVLHAGPSEAGRACLGAWRGGEAVAFAALPESPTLSTPLYGYHLPEASDDAARERFTAAGGQPGSVRAWLAEAGVDRATIMPVIDSIAVAAMAMLKIQPSVVSSQSPGADWSMPMIRVIGSLNTLKA